MMEVDETTHAQTKFGLELQEDDLNKSQQSQRAKQPIAPFEAVNFPSEKSKVYQTHLERLIKKRETLIQHLNDLFPRDPHKNDDKDEISPLLDQRHILRDYKKWPETLQRERGQFYKKKFLESIEKWRAGKLDHLSRLINTTNATYQYVIPVLINIFQKFIVNPVTTYATDMILRELQDGAVSMYPTLEEIEQLIATVGKYKKQKVPKILDDLSRYYVNNQSEIDSIKDYERTFDWRYNEQELKDKLDVAEGEKRKQGFIPYRLYEQFIHQFLDHMLKDRLEKEEIHVKANTNLLEIFVDEMARANPSIMFQDPATLNSEQLILFNSAWRFCMFQNCDVQYVKPLLDQFFPVPLIRILKFTFYEQNEALLNTFNLEIHSKTTPLISREARNSNYDELKYLFTQHSDSRFPPIEKNAFFNVRKLKYLPMFLQPWTISSRNTFEIAYPLLLASNNGYSWLDFMNIQSVLESELELTDDDIHILVTKYFPKIHPSATPMTQQKTIIELTDANFKGVDQNEPLAQLRIPIIIEIGESAFNTTTGASLLGRDWQVSYYTDSSLNDLYLLQSIDHERPGVITVGTTIDLTDVISIPKRSISLFIVVSNGQINGMGTFVETSTIKARTNLHPIYIQITSRCVRCQKPFIAGVIQDNQLKACSWYINQSEFIEHQKLSKLGETDFRISTILNLFVRLISEQIIQPLIQKARDTVIQHNLSRNVLDRMDMKIEILSTQRNEFLSVFKRFDIKEPTNHFSFEMELIAGSTTGEEQLITNFSSNLLAKVLETQVPYKSLLKTLTLFFRNSAIAKKYFEAVEQDITQQIYYPKVCEKLLRTLQFFITKYAVKNSDAIKQQDSNTSNTLDQDIKYVESFSLLQMAAYYDAVHGTDSSNQNTRNQLAYEAITQPLFPPKERINYLYSIIQSRVIQLFFDKDGYENFLQSTGGVSPQQIFRESPGRQYHGLHTWKSVVPDSFVLLVESKLQVRRNDPYKKLNVQTELWWDNEYMINDASHVSNRGPLVTSTKNLVNGYKSIHTFEIQVTVLVSGVNIVHLVRFIIKIPVNIRSVVTRNISQISTRIENEFKQLQQTLTRKKFFDIVSDIELANQLLFDTNLNFLN